MNDSRFAGLKSGRLSVLHMIIILLSLAMTIGAWQYSKHQVASQIETRFNAARDRTIGLISERMSRYEDALWSGVAAVTANGSQMSHTEWRSFAQTLDIGERYPGIHGIGIIEYFDRAELDSFMAERAQEDRNFAIYPEHDRNMLAPIVFVEPEAENSKAVGLDMMHESNRRSALLASRDTGKAQITSTISLVQESSNTPGFLFFTPFYAGGPPANLAERRERFLGVVYAPFVVRELVEGLLSKELRDVHFSLSDGEQLIYNEHDSNDQLHDTKPMFSEVVTLNLYGHKWHVDIRTNRAFRAHNSFEQPTLILLGGLMIEMLIIALLYMMSRANTQAHEYAHELTAELRCKSEKLERANEEIEQFVYVASHDLKTPVRGIGYLADLLEEDLTEHLEETDVGETLQSHLELIRERVARMNDLTRGIMEFSRAGRPSADDDHAVAPVEIIEACVSDFKVEKNQITLASDVANISRDGHTFRRVLENLIGNAFKYHPNPDAASVAVSICDTGDRLRVSVSDNGAGIAPQFHNRIFDVFQTLRTAEEKESTGIGLAIVRKSVQKHGYDVSVVSEVGAGAEFLFDWPKYPTAPQQQELELENVA